MFNPSVFSDYYDKELLSQENICGDLFPEARMLCIRMDLGVTGAFPPLPPNQSHREALCHREIICFRKYHYGLL